MNDCGIAHGDNHDVVDRCAKMAYDADATFRALYELDDGRLQALVHAAGGDYLLLRESEAGGIERADCDGAHLADNIVTCTDPSAFEAVCH